MTSTSIEKSGAGDLVASGDTAEARRLNSLYKQCVRLAHSELVPKALRGKPDNVFALALYGEQYGLSPVHSTQKIYIIEGTFEPKAEVIAGVIMRAGHEVFWDLLSDDVCTVSIRRAGTDRWQTYSYTIEKARKAEALDVWVERKVKKPGDDWAKRETYVIGNDLGVDAEKVKNAPDWAKQLIESGSTRRKDPWWTHPEDLLAAKAIKRHGRRVCPDVLLGLDEEEPVDQWTPGAVLEQPPAPDDDEPTSAPAEPDVESEPEEEIEDADIVEPSTDEPPADPDPVVEVDPAAEHAKAIKRLMVTCSAAFPETDAPKGTKTHRQKLLRKAAQYAVLHKSAPDRARLSATDLTVDELVRIEAWVHSQFVSPQAVTPMRYEIRDGDVVRFILGTKYGDIAPADADASDAAA